MEGDQVYILLSVSRGLTTHVSPQLRAVIVDFDQAQSIFTLRFFYDGEVTDELFDLASCASVEIDPGVSEYEMKGDLTTRLDYPAPIPIEGRLVYLRYEPVKTVYYQKSALDYAEPTLRPIACLALSIQEALLGKVTPELRQTSIAMDPAGKKLDFYFVYDGEITELHTQLAHRAIDKAAAPFREYSVNRHIMRVDLPKRTPNPGMWCIYQRAETYDLID